MDDSARVYFSRPAMRTQLAPMFDAWERVVEWDAGQDHAQMPKIVVGLFYLSAWHEIQDFGRRMRTEGNAFVCIAIDAGSVWAVPIADPTAPGCIGCLQTWMINNHPQKNRWSELYEKVGGATPIALPWAEPFYSMLGHLVTMTLQSIADKANALSIERELIVLDAETGSCRRHRFIEDPTCKVCSECVGDSAEASSLSWQSRLKVAPREYRTGHVEKFGKEIRDRFVDWRTGLCRRVYRDLTSTLLPMSAAEYCILGHTDMERGFGRTNTREKSETVAVLEALERFAGHAPRAKTTRVRASFDALTASGDAIDPRHFILHSQEQLTEPGFTQLPYTDDLEYNWVWSYSLERGKPMLVPEQLAYYRLSRTSNPPVNRYIYETSNGCALGSCIEEAVFYALMEVIERDAYLTYWYSRFVPVEIDLEEVEDRRIAALVARAESSGYRLRVFDISLEFQIPTILALMHDPRDNAPVATYCASGAHSNPEKAILSAIVEVVSSMGVYRHSMPPLRDRALAALDDPTLVQQMHDHVLLYSLPEATERLSFLLNAKEMATVRDRFPKWYEQEPPADLTVELESLIERVLTVARDVIVVDQSFSALKRSGLSCVKVLAPGLLPVTFGHQYRRVNLNRLNRAAAHLGSSMRFDLGNINPYPHNFP